MKNRFSRSSYYKKRFFGYAGICIFAGILAASLFFALPLLHSPKTPEEKSPALPAVKQTEESFDIVPVATGSEDKFLILINWDNPSSGERPGDLVRQEDVFGEEVVLVNGEGSIQIDAAEAAQEMFLAATAQGIGPFQITTAYRSVEYQEELFQKRKKQDPSYGEDPKNYPVKVLPGKFSEHTTGLAVDILSVSYSQADDGFADTAEGKWLLEHAHEFGFILRYPKEKEHITGVIYEPWHYRYVGKEAAKEIWEQGICLEEYLQK